MRRDTSLLILTLCLAVAGATCLLASMVGEQTPALLSWGVTLLLLSSGGGVATGALIRRECQALSRRLLNRAASASPDLSHIAPASACLSPLTKAFNSLLLDASRHVDDAAIRCKDLEIRLKVADAERQHAESVIYSISDAVLVTDPFDELVLANDSAARTFDFDLRRSHRSPVQQVLHDPKVIELIRETRQNDGRNAQRVVEHRVRTPNGDRTFKITLSTVPGGTAEPGGGGVVAVLHDVTHEKEVAQMKNDFVSNVSHELRTPLASVKAYIELLIDGEADDEKTRREFYEVIQNEANRLGRLIDNILSISRIESGLVKVNKQPQSLTVVVKDALEVIAPQAGSKQIRLVEQLTPVFYQTLADRDMLYQAVLNLMSNAVKYTPAGGQITVETTVDESRKKVIARITDTGVGIPPQDLPFVFDKFYRAEVNNHMAKGTGLGLSLVKHIVEAVHQGRIIVESEVGKGSCFSFELDLCE